MGGTRENRREDTGRKGERECVRDPEPRRVCGDRERREETPPRRDQGLPRREREEEKGGRRAGRQE